MRELWQKIVLTSGTQLYSLVIGIVILMITARWLGPEGRGTIATVTTWVGLFSTVGYLSLGQVSIYRATQQRTQAWLAPTLGSLLFLDAVISLLVWTLATTLYIATRGAVFNSLSPLLLEIGFLALPLMIWEQYGSALLMALDRVMVYNRAQVTGRTVGLTLIGVAWILNLGIPGVLAAMLMLQAIVSLTGLRYLFSVAESKVKPDHQTIRELLKGGFKLHLNYVGGFLITSSSILIVNHYLGAAETGYYQLALQLIGVLAVVPQSASMVIYGKVTQLGPDAAWVYQRKIIFILMLCMAGIAAIAAFLAPWAIPLVVGARFAPSVRLFQILLLSMLGGALATAMSSQWIGRGLFGLMSVLTIGSGIVTLLANMLLVPRYGVYGAAWTTVGIYAFVLIGQGWMIFKCELEFTKSAFAREST